MHSATASLMWVYTIQHATENADKLTDLIDNVTAIDSKFSYPYAFAALVLPDIAHSPDKAVEIAMRGIENADPDWRIPYYLATTYHIFFQDREKAAFYFDLAARTPGANSKIQTIALSYGTAPTFREQTKLVWISIYDSSNDEIVKDRAQKYIAQIDILDFLDKAVRLYIEKYHKYPEKVDDLVIGKIIKEVPKSPLGLQFILRYGGEVIAK